jgi:hypothetical protein
MTMCVLEIRRIIMIMNNYNKLNNLGEINKFLRICSLPKLNLEEIESLTRPITKEIESVIEDIPEHKNPGQDGFMSEFYQALKELIPNFLKPFQKI